MKKVIQTPKRKRVVILLLFFLGLLSGNSASSKPTASDDVDSLLVRAESLGKCQVKQDYRCAYDFFLPELRESYGKAFRKEWVGSMRKQGVHTEVKSFVTKGVSIFHEYAKVNSEIEGLVKEHGSWVESREQATSFWTFSEGNWFLLASAPKGWNEDSATVVLQVAREESDYENSGTLELPKEISALLERIEHYHQLTVEGACEGIIAYFGPLELHPGEDPEAARRFLVEGCERDQKTLRSISSKVLTISVLDRHAKVVMFGRGKARDGTDYPWVEASGEYEVYWISGDEGWFLMIGTLAEWDEAKAMTYDLRRGKRGKAD